MKRLLGAVIVAGACFLSAVAADQPNVFWWEHVKEQTYYSYGDPHNWTYGTEAAHTIVPAAAPGENDWIAYLPHWDGSGNSNGYWYFDLGNESVTTKGVWEGEKIWYPYRELRVENGTITFTDQFTTRRHSIYTYNNGNIVFGPNCVLNICWGGAINNIETRSAGTSMDFLGEIKVDSTLRIMTCVNTTMTIDPKKFWFYTGFLASSPYATIENKGTMNFPHGLTMESSAQRATGGDFRFIQTSGTMTISGPLAYTGKILDNFSFALNGGTLKIEDDVSMAFMRTVGMPNANTTATIDIAEGKTLDWSNATFAEGTTLNVTGSGSIKFGGALPAHLNLDPTVQVVLTKSVTIPSGTVTGYGASTFVIELATRDTFVITFDDAVLKPFLVSNLRVPAGWTVTDSETAVVIQAEGKTFWWNDPTGSKGALAFDDPANWSYMTEDGIGSVATDFPGENDMLAYIYRTGYYTGSNHFDLRGRTIRMKGYDYAYAAKIEDIGFPAYRQLSIHNGTFEFTDSFKTRQHRIYAYSGAKFVFGRTCQTAFEWTDAINNVETRESGAEVDLYGDVEVATVRFTNVANATMVIDPETFVFTDQCYDMAPYSGFFNSGTMSFPRGLAFDGTAKHTKLGHDFRFEQVSGTMILGGPLTATAKAKENYTFDLRGGTLAVKADVSFDMFVCAGLLTANASATIDISEGKTLDWSNATFAEGTTLNVTGLGTLILGESQPDTMNLTDGVEIAFARSATLKTITGYAGAKLAVRPASRADIVLKTSDGALRAKIASGSAGTNRAWDNTGNDLVNYATDSKVFIWKTSESTYRSFFDPQYWLEGIYLDTATAVTDVPGDRDWIGFISRTDTHVAYFTQSYDLQGRHVKVKGITDEGTVYGTGPKGQGFGERVRQYKNGTIEFSESYFAHRDKVTVAADAKFIVAPTCASDLQWGGAENTFAVNGELDWQGSLSLCCLRVTGAAGSTVNFAPTSVSFNSGAADTAPSFLDNSGTMKFPSGLAFTGVKRTRVHSFTVRQRAGEMVVGGDFTGDANVETDNFVFDLIGGQLTVANDSAFTVFDAYGLLTANASATLDIAEGKTLNWSKATSAAGTTLNVAGTGTLVLGATAPAETLALTEGGTLRFVELGATLPKLTGIAAAKFEFVGALRNLDRLMTSADGKALAAIAAKLSMPAGFTASVEDGWIVARVALPEPSEEAGIFSGAETVVEITSDYDKERIVLLNGATAVVKGTVEALPPVTLYYDATLRFASDAAAPMPPITAYYDLAHLPVVEIAKGAVVTTAEDYKFKNVRLNWYGEINTSGATTFGTADEGETAMFALTADDGAKLNAPHNLLISFMNPTQGGRVVSPEGLVFRKMTYLPAYAQFFCFEIGRNNPIDEQFDFTLDGAYLDLRGNKPMYFGGAARIRCLNGGGLYKHDAWRSWGLYGGLVFRENATLELDSESYFYYHYNQKHVVEFNPSTVDAEQLVLKNGSWFEAHVPNGLDRAAVRVEDAFVNVRALQSDKDEVGRSDWYWDIFNRFTRINVPEGKFFGVRPVTSAYGVEWDRTLAIGAPVTGGGSLLVTNDTAELTIKAIVKLGMNTATGVARATAGACETKLVFADGSNWAGTLVANECIGFTNLTAAASPATVTVKDVRFEGALPIRVWKGDVNAADRLQILGSLSCAKGGFAPVEVNGRPFAVGDTFTVGTIPAANLPENYERKFTSAKWKLVAEGDGDTKTLKVVYEPLGAILFLM